MTRIQNALLFLTGISMPLINLRIDIGLYTMSLFMVCIIILFIYMSLKFYTDLNKVTFNIGIYEALILIFVVIYGFSLFYSANQLYGIEQFIKLSIVIVFYFLITQIIVKNPQYIKYIIRYAIIGLAVYICYLAYYYLIIFDASYIGVNTQYETEAGKNSLAFVVSIILPFILTDLFKKENIKILNLNDIFKLFLMITVIASVFLIQSRGLFIVTLLYITLSFIFNFEKKQSFIKVITTLLSTTILTILIFPDVVKDAFIEEFSGLGVLFNQNADVEELSYSRSDLLNRGIDLFSESPIYGVGGGSFRYYGSSNADQSHNDYLLILSEQGLLGFISFVLLLISFILLAYKNYRYDNTQISKSLFLAICGISFYFLLINAYDNLLFWTILAFIRAMGIIRKKDLKNSPLILNSKSNI